MKYSSVVSVVVSIILIGLLLTAMSCEPISSPEPPRSYDALAYVNAVSIPETVQVNQKFLAQINFQNVCGGVLALVRRDLQVDTIGADSGRIRITYSPVLRVDPDLPCNGTPAWQTVTDTLTYTALGTYIIAVSGNNGLSRQYVQVVSYKPVLDYYRFHVVYHDAQGNFIPLQTGTVSFPSKNLNLAVTADSSGAWDTTFVDATASMKFIVDKSEFQAVKGNTIFAKVILQ